MRFLGLIVLLASVEAQDGEQDVLHVAAVLSSEDQMTISGTYLSKGRLNPGPAPEGRGQKFTTELLDETGKSIASVPFTADLSRGPIPVTLALPYPAEMRTLVVRREGRELARMLRSPNPPAAAVRSVTVDNKKIAFTLDLSDKDGDLLNFHPVLEADGKRNLLHTGVYDSKNDVFVEAVGGMVRRAGRTFSFDRDFLGGGKKSFVLVWVTDGLNFVESPSAEFSLGETVVKLDVSWQNATVPARGTRTVPGMPERIPEISNGSFGIVASRSVGAVTASVTGKALLTSDRDGVVLDERDPSGDRSFYLSPGPHAITVTFFEGKEEAARQSFPLIVDLEPAEWLLVEIPAALRPDPERTKVVQTLLEKLGVDSAGDREKAQKQLLAIGPPAIPLVRQALEAKDPEVRARARAIFEGLIARWEGRWACVPSPSRRAPDLVRKLRGTSNPPGPIWSYAIKGLLKRCPDEDGLWAELLGCMDCLHLRSDIVLALGAERYARIHRRWLETVKESIVEGLPAEIASVSDPRFGKALAEGARFTISFSLPLAPAKLDGWAAEALIDGAGIERLEFLKHSAYRQGDTSHRTVSFFCAPLPAGEHRVSLFLYQLENGVAVRIHKVADHPFTIPKGLPKKD
jgi:hypothetical protein